MKLLELFSSSTHVVYGRDRLNLSILGAFDGCVDKTEFTIPNNNPKTIEIRRSGEVICTGKIYINS